MAGLNTVQVDGTEVAGFHKTQRMDFIFHSVIDDGGHRKYFSIYRIDDSHFRAECHHFNQARQCEGDFEIEKIGTEWKPSNPKFDNEAKFIGEEIDRMVYSSEKS